MQAHGPGLTLAPDDDAQLQERLTVFLAAQQARFDQEKRREEKQRRSKLRRMRLQDIRRRYAGSLAMTLETVKQYCGNRLYSWPDDSQIADAYLVQRWVTSQRIDLAEMERQQEELKKWLRVHAATRVPLHDAVLREFRHALMPLDFDEPFAGSFIKFAAGIRFRVEFADRSVAYLTDMDEGTLTLDEITKLRGIQPERSGVAWQSADYETKPKPRRPTFGMRAQRTFADLWHSARMSTGMSPYMRDFLPDNKNRLAEIDVHSVSDGKRIREAARKNKLLPKWNRRRK
jgi:hypothetical protein